MDPLLDEKIVVTISASLMEILGEWFEIDAIREAYGPTNNEGLCYEFCAKMRFSGSLQGNIFVGLDGYTKLLILPHIIEKFQISDKHPELTESALVSFVEHIGKLVASELDEYLMHIQVDIPEIVSHKLIEVKREDFRKYMLIFFLKSSKKKAYLGRIYVFLALNK